ncbi:MAG TPA: ATP-binding cassette domain-containing protein, partial [Geobacteraceae bacterium]
MLKAVDGVDFSLEEGETLAIVGESGCGKSVTASSLMRLVPSPGKIMTGAIIFSGQDLMRLTDEEMRSLRGNRISMIFQDPMTALNPVLTVGAQIMEGLRLHRQLTATDARMESHRLLQEVG